MPNLRNLLIILAIGPITAVAVPFEGHRVLISTASPHAVEVGRKIALKGGNVVDVAVATALALSVTSPYYAALGGGGFALVKMNTVVDALDFREVAPKSIKADHFRSLPKEASITGGHAVGVPGLPAGLWELHKKYGKLKWSDLFTEPLKLARQGFPFSGEFIQQLTAERDRLSPAGKAIFLRRGGALPRPGENLTQPSLAQALDLFRRQNVKGFYQGPVAEDVVRTVTQAAGRLSLEDLKSYKVRWLSPLTTEYEKHKIYLMPPPSSGGVIAMTGLRLIEKLQVKNKEPLSAEELHALAEIQSRAFRGRVLLGDPDFVENPVSFLTSGTYFEELTNSFDPKKAVVLSPLKPQDVKESHQTTHLSVLDSEGHAVAMTITLNGSFGSGLVTTKFGVALNNQMDDFTTRPNEPNYYGLVQGIANEVAPGKRPLSSMTPTLVEKHGKVVMSLGAPGGGRIPSSVLQVLYRSLGRGMDVDSAIQSPRVHHQYLPNILFIDRDRLSPEVRWALKDKGHTLEESSTGKVYVVRLREDGVLEGAFDARGEGAAGGI